MLFAFDFDGVIVDSFDHNIALMNRTAREFGLEVLFSRERVRDCRNMTWEYVAERCGIPAGLRPAFSERLFALLLGEPPETRLFDGMPEVLRSVGAAGRVVIVTSNFESVVHRVLALTGLADAVEAVFGTETSASKTDKLRMAAERFAVPLERTVKIGDCISDIEHAQAAGTRSVAVGWGFHTLEQLRTAGPDAEAETPEKLGRLLREWAAVACPPQILSVNGQLNERI